MSDTSHQFGAALPLTRRRRICYHSSCFEGETSFELPAVHLTAGGYSV